MLTRQCVGFVSGVTVHSILINGRAVDGFFVLDMKWQPFLIVGLVGLPWVMLAACLE